MTYRSSRNKKHPLNFFNGALLAIFLMLALWYHGMNANGKTYASYVAILDSADNAIAGLQDIASPATISKRELLRKNKELEELLKMFVGEHYLNMELKKELANLKKEEYDPDKMIMARVVRNNPARLAGEMYFRTDAGAKIKEGELVTHGGFAIGHVKKYDNKSATGTIDLFFTPAKKIYAVTSENNVPFIVRGGFRGVYEAELPKPEKIEIGELVMLQSAGVPLGIVKRIMPEGANGSFKKVFIAPPYNPLNIGYVIIELSDK